MKPNKKKGFWQFKKLTYDAHSLYFIYDEIEKKNGVCLRIETKKEQNYEKQPN